MAKPKKKKTAKRTTKPTRRKSMPAKRVSATKPRKPNPRITKKKPNPRIKPAVEKLRKLAEKTAPKRVFYRDERGRFVKRPTVEQFVLTVPKESPSQTRIRELEAQIADQERELLARRERDVQMRDLEDQLARQATYIEYLKKVPDVLTPDWLFGREKWKDGSDERLNAAYDAWQRMNTNRFDNEYKDLDDIINEEAARGEFNRRELYTLFWSPSGFN